MGFFARVQQDLGRNDLQLGRAAGVRPRLFSHGGGAARVVAFSAPAIEVTRRLQVELAIIGNRRTETAPIEDRVTKDLAGLLCWLDDITRGVGCGGGLPPRFGA